MPGGSPRHGAVFAQDLARDLSELGSSQSQLFGGTGFDAGLLQAEKPVAAFVDIAGFFENAAKLTGNDMLGFQRGQTRETRRSGLLFYVGHTAPTVMGMLRNTARYRRVFSDAVEIDVSTLERDGVAKWYFSVPASVERRQIVEFGISGIH